jgi:pectate disaccharide-lyase
MNRATLIITLLLLARSVSATNYYLATNGNDVASGTSSNTPFRTPERAIRAVFAGDTLYALGGTYSLTGLVKTARAGLATNYCKMWAYPGEHPIFNASNAPSGFRALEIRHDYWHVKGIEIDGARNNAIIIAGSSGVPAGSNIVEGCVIHHSNNDGIVLGSSSGPTHDNLILNCDSYSNYQEGSGGNNGDGFAAKDGHGAGNIYRGCRAWLNADDGWDFYTYDTDAAITLENCWAFHNGSNQWNVGSWSGNGNGFKLGRDGSTQGHTLTQCLAFKNHSKGFDHNGSTAAHTLYNNTGFNNTKWNFSFYGVPVSGQNVFKNNLSYSGGGITNVGSPIMVSNSWQNGLSVTPADFVSLDDSLAFTPRNTDYSLPTNGLARLVAGSDMIDAGVDVGLSYNGPAPDLGAYEFVAAVLPQSIFINAVSAADTGLTLHVTGLTSHGNVIVHTSPDLAAWTPIFTNPPVTGGWQYFDPNATNETQRFYKVQEQ